MDRPQLNVRESLEEVRARGYAGIITYLREQYPSAAAIGGVGGWRATQYVKNPALLDRVHGEVARVLEYFEQLGPERGMNGLLAMLRYTLEGEAKTYVPDRTFYDFLLRKFGPGLTDNRRLLDLGCGNVGPNLQYFDERMGNPKGSSRGVDLSGSFALMDNADLGNIHVGVIDAPIDELRRQLGGALQPAGMVLTSLTLDRVAHPRRMLETMDACASPGATLVVGALLPNNPEDDEPGIANKIVYTPNEHRIVSGCSVDEDVRELRTWIEDRFGAQVQVDSFAYASESSGMKVVYDNYRVFSWTKPSVDKKE